MKNEIREVQKYFEYKISNGDFEVRQVSEHNTMEISIDGFVFNFGYTKANNEVFQHFFPNFMELDCSRIVSNNFIVIHKATNQVKTERQAL